MNDVIFGLKMLKADEQGVVRFKMGQLQVYKATK